MIVTTLVLNAKSNATKAINKRTAVLTDSISKVVKFIRITEYILENILDNSRM